MATNITSRWAYPNIDPNQDIVGINGLVKAMPALYGPNFDSAHFTPLFDNIRTGALISKPHHCTHKDTKGHAMTRKCVTEGHQSYCLEWVDEGGRRVRCGQRLKVESVGCGKHLARLMRHSNNLLVKNLVAGKLDSISWGQLNDFERVTENDASQEHIVDETTEAILAQYEADMEELDTVGVLPQRNHTAYSVHVAFNQSRIQKDRTAAEERRLRAAERRSSAAGKSGITGRLKKVASNMKEAVTSEITESEKTRLMRSSYFKPGPKKSSRPDPSVFKNKRGGKNVSDLPS